MARHPGAFLALLLVACTGDRSPHSSVEDGSDAAPEVQPAEAGVCFGARTSCSVPDFPPLVHGPDKQVSCADGDPFTLAWKAELGTFDAVLPNCPAVDPMVAQGMGSYWSVAELRPSTADNLLGEVTVGYVIEQFDEAGKLRRAIPSDLRRQVDGVLDEGVTRVVQSNVAGELLWATASPDGSTLELRRYSSRGELEAAMHPVRGAASSFGDVRWDSDGSALVAYRYPEGDVVGDESPRLLPGVARFDARGRPQWNQTFFSEMARNDPTITAMSVAIAGVDRAGNAALQMRVLHSGGTSVDATVLELDPDGNVVWAHRIDGAQFINQGSLHSSAGLSKNGILSVAYTQESPFGAVVERLDADGASRGRLLFEGVPLEAMVTFDGDGRALVSWQKGFDSAVTTWDFDAASCTVRSLSTLGCFLAADGTQLGCDDPFISLTESGDVFFGVSKTVGLARWR